MITQSPMVGGGGLDGQILPNSTNGDWCDRSLGYVTHLTDDVAIGWAWIPRRPGYRVLMHAFDNNQLVRSTLVAPVQNQGLLLQGPAHVFKLELGGIPRKRQGHLRFVIGETGAELTVIERAAVEEQPKSTVVTVEDLLSIPSLHPWIRGATYLDAIEAMSTQEELVEYIYRDYLGRSVDQPALAEYLAQLRNGRLTFDGLRQSIIMSEEYRRRSFGDGPFPGAFFSDPLIYAPCTAFPGSSVASRRKISAGKFLSLWGEGFVRSAYFEICRSQIPEEFFKPIISMLDDTTFTKLDVLKEIVKIANTIFPAVELIEDGPLERMPARRHHEVPLSLLLEAETDAEFVRDSHRIICGDALEEPAADQITSRLVGNAISRMDVVKSFVSEAHNRYGIPAVVCLDLPKQDLSLQSAESAIDIPLDGHVVGYGWHKIEGSSDAPFRWMPQNAGLVMPNVDGDSLIMAISGALRMSDEAVTSLACSINGVRVEGEVSLSGADCWSFNSSLLNADSLPRCFPNVLSFKILNSNIPQNPLDPRFLSVAISHVRLANSTADLDGPSMTETSANEPSNKKAKRLKQMGFRSR